MKGHLTRKSTGSIPSFSAISSIAISSAISPGASPGARMALPSAKSSTASRIAISRRWIEEHTRSPRFGRLPDSAPTDVGGGAVATQQRVTAERDKIGRNDPCWCGSGKKFKKCHGA